MLLIPADAFRDAGSITRQPPPHVAGEERWLKELAALKNLTRMHLRTTNVTAASEKEFKKAMPMR